MNIYTPDDATWSREREAIEVLRGQPPHEPQT